MLERELECLVFQAIDVWMGLCTAFVFAALVEFTIVNFWFRKQRARAGVRVRYLENGKIQRVSKEIKTSSLAKTGTLLHELPLI